MKYTEYLIIGAGIVGCSTAYFLAKENKKVMIVDRTYPCNEASGVNAGGLELLQQPPRSLPLHKLSAELWNKFQNEEGIDVGYHRTGGLYCILREEDLHLLDEQEERFEKNGLPVQRLNKEEVSAKVPYICDNVIAANFSPMSGYSNPLKAGVSILMAAKKLGAEFFDHQIITKIEPAADGKGNGRGRAARPAACDLPGIAGLPAGPKARPRAHSPARRLPRANPPFARGVK